MLFEWVSRKTGETEMAGNWTSWMARAEESHGREFDAVERDIFKAGFEAGNRMVELPHTFWNDDAQYDTPNDSEIMQCLELGDVFKLTAAWYKPALFKVVKVPDDESDDYAVEAITSNLNSTS